jgi:hypothetical protein
MTHMQLTTVIAAAVGALGAILTFIGSYALQPSEGAVWGGVAVDAENDKIAAKNARRLVFQRIGLGMICCSFVLQGVSVFLA